MKATTLSAFLMIILAGCGAEGATNDAGLSHAYQISVSGSAPSDYQSISEIQIRQGGANHSIPVSISPSSPGMVSVEPAGCNEPIRLCAMFSDTAGMGEYASCLDLTAQCGAESICTYNVRKFPDAAERSIAAQCH